MLANIGETILSSVAISCHLLLVSPNLLAYLKAASLTPICYGKWLLLSVKAAFL
jgi:hypothetical protein